MRLDKLLANSGFGSRKEVKQLINSGQVSVNQTKCKNAGLSVDPALDQVRVNDTLVSYQAYFYYLLNKPAGIISATEDNKHQTVIDWLGPNYSYQQLFPVGRLDIDTTGLLLLTNNGDLAHQLLAPKRHVNKVYQATIAGIVDQNDILAFKQGLDLGDFITQPADLHMIEMNQDQNTCQIEVTIQEGKFHQVKRMFEAVGKRVESLHRIQMGPLKLTQELQVGQWRPLNEVEAEALIPYGFK